MPNLPIEVERAHKRLTTFIQKLKLQDLDERILRHLINNYLIRVAQSTQETEERRLRRERPYEV